MGIKERREREKQYIRGTIMKIVNRILSDEGWANVTIRKIADEIEYSPPIIYEHFDSKEAILGELIREAYSKLLKQFQKVTKDVEDPLTCLYHMADANYDFCIANSGYAKAIYGLDGIPAGHHIDIEEWREITVMVKEKVAQVLKIEDPSDPRVMETYLQIRFLTSGAIVAAVGVLHVDKKEAPFNDHNYMKSMMRNGLSKFFATADQRINA